LRQLVGVEQQPVDDLIGENHHQPAMALVERGFVRLAWLSNRR